MSISTFITWISGSNAGNKGESMSYDAIFKGSTTTPSTGASRNGSFLPGLRGIENDVDSYFKDVFAGPVF